MILDACCSKRSFWYDRECEDVVYMDVLASVEPMVVGDFREMPFREAVFSMVVFDPPHDIRRVPPTGEILAHYGWLHSETWQDDLKRAFDEIRRVFIKGAYCIFKWNTTSRYLDRVLPLISLEKLVGHKTRERRWPRRHQPNPSETFWILMRR